ncbi:MAG: polyphosphate polymerase domain-containing protein [Flavobacteriia bacterium]|nr:polyphosphate polymerase domain-containing protein [Flavobacteriia bacterium]
MILIKELSAVLSEFCPISLNEMDEVKLMNRVDTKFAFSFIEFKAILNEISNDYKVLEIEGTRTPFYESLYYDESNFKFYNDHHVGRVDRFKVRFRKYVESNLTFLEIKHKIKGRTKKSRIVVDSIPATLDEKQLFFLKKNISKTINLTPKLWNSFHRITLVNNELKERLTLDFQLTFKWSDNKKEFNNLVIAELKQEIVNRNSPFFKLMKNKQIRPYRLSKYCIGAIELYGKENIKYNRFKEKLLKLQKINKYE